MLYSRSRFSWELSEIGAAKPDRARLLREAPAAFRRLCVETYDLMKALYPATPAAFRRLCVETGLRGTGKNHLAQPPSGGCVLKHVGIENIANMKAQPPSGGCVLKRCFWIAWSGCRYPAAFRRLCVETVAISQRYGQPIHQPPSGGCVLKHHQQAERRRHV